MVMRRCEDHQFVFVGELPKVAKGAVCKAAPPKIAPMSLVDLLNDSTQILMTTFRGVKTQYGRPEIKGVETSVCYSWLGERNWQIELSATNAQGGMIEGLDHFLRAVRQANDLLDIHDPKEPTDHWELMKVLEEDFEPTAAWTTKPGAPGTDGIPSGVTLVLNCTTKPEVSFEYGIGYWEKE